MANDKQIQDIVNTLPTIKRICERLNGDHSAQSKAVLVGQLALLKEIPAAMRANLAVGATPTKAEFDLLLGDVRAVYAMLVEIARNLN